MKNDLNITDEGALLVKMSRHKSNYDGTICAKPHVHDCGTSEFFRNNYCRKGIPGCGEKDLFHPENPMLVKVIKDDVPNPFEQQIGLLKEGKSPIIFFFSKGRNAYQYYLIGAYTVKSIETLNLGHKKEIHIIPKDVIRLPMDVLENDFLWNGSWGELGWCRYVYRNKVASSLEIMLETLRTLNSREYESDSLEHVLEALTDTAAAAVETAEPALIDLKTGVETAATITKKQVGEAAVPEDFQLVVPEQKAAFDQVVDRVIAISEQHGYYYDRNLVAAVHNSLLVNPFLILSGISGGGKTSFVQFYAMGLGSELEIISVRPDWTSPSHLLGVYNPFEGDFVPTVATEFILRANDEYQRAREEQREPKPYLLLLDEMNLARAEHYFSDFLSKMQLVDEKKRVIRLYDEHKGDHPRLLHIQPNLKIVGTVNIDETTFLFSPKVLDRASYFSLNEINIEGMGRVIANRSKELRYTELMQKLVFPELRDLNSKLSEFGQPFGYRTAWEIIKWIDTGLSVGVINSVYEGLDIQVENKILVKLSDYRTGTMFQALATYFKDRANPYDPDSLIFEKSLHRIENLIARAEREEFAIGQQ